MATQPSSGSSHSTNRPDLDAAVPGSADLLRPSQDFVEIVQGLEIDDYSRKRIDASVTELIEERDAVKELGLI